MYKTFLEDSLQLLQDTNIFTSNLKKIKIFKDAQLRMSSENAQKTISSATDDKLGLHEKYKFL